MQATSNDAPQLANSFFTLAQILSFNQPPPNEALRKVAIGGGNTAAYLEGEYIRLVLNLLIGQGMWELKTKLLSHDVRDIKKDVFTGSGNNRRKEGTEDWLGISACVHTALIIHARDGSDKTLVYEASTVGDGMNHPEKSISDALDKAIKSAETDGLKRCAINLGRVFGLDINNKVKKQALPLNIAHFQAKIDEAHRQRALATANDKSGSAVGNVHILDHAKQVENKTGGADAGVETSKPAVDTTPAQSSAEKIQDKPAEAKPSNSKQEAANREPESSAPSQKPEPQRGDRKPAPAVADKGQQTDKSGASEQTELWELSLTPSNYQEWIRCIQTMAQRVNRMTTEAELDNFIRRFDKLIKKLPIYEAKDNEPARDFKARWAFIVNKRRDEMKKAAPDKNSKAA
jgi:hypothetical protein